MVKSILCVLKYLNILSLDVVAGACISSYFIADLLNVQLYWESIALLGLTVWLIYTFDHLNDAKQVGCLASTSRHRFHQVYFKELTLTSIAVLFFAAFLMFQVPVSTVVWGAALACLVIAYFFMLFLMKLKAVYHKEIMIALLYAAGIMLAPLSVFKGALNMNILLIFSQFTLLAFTNLLTFAVFEIHSDEKDDFPSLARLIGEGRAILLLRIFIVIQLLITLTLCFQPDLRSLEEILALMVALLGGVVFLRTYFIKMEVYRIVGDAIFLVPLIGILVN
ncbi:hypothetical protein C900_00361 [Fulvivirga imtechensis AK7]|uniref:UbiA prenyltransferase n=1 Tax=Fulvivirga imtechensis AK7 TaxID=1237149 RepID=L8JHZ3_9BACT|nr:hypothetical protein [Fulvivirga imtechensis]ELR68440.1 hypothetical protein C900_00361 [Fulvivirga imtechensis AK7]